MKDYLKNTKIDFVINLYKNIKLSSLQLFNDNISFFSTVNNLSFSDNEPTDVHLDIEINLFNFSNLIVLQEMISTFRIDQYIEPASIPVMRNVWRSDREGFCRHFFMLRCQQSELSLTFKPKSSWKRIRKPITAFFVLIFIDIDQKVFFPPVYSKQSPICPNKQLFVEFVYCLKRSLELDTWNSGSFVDVEES